MQGDYITSDIIIIIIMINSNKITHKTESGSWTQHQVNSLFTSNKSKNNFLQCRKIREEKSLTEFGDREYLAEKAAMAGNTHHKVGNNWVMKSKWVLCTQL